MLPRGCEPEDAPCFLRVNRLMCGFFLKILFIFIFRGERKEKAREKHQCVVASHEPPTGDLAHNPGMCPDWESNQRPFGLQAGTQSTEPQQPGQCVVSNKALLK